MSARLLVILATLVAPAIASAQASLTRGLGGPRDFGSECLAPNDDGSSTAIDRRAAWVSRGSGGSRSGAAPSSARTRGMAEW